MQTRLSFKSARRHGYALLLVITFTGLALILATGIFQYTSTTVSLNHRHNEYQKAAAAAEAATEKVVAQVSADYRDLGDGYVMAHLANYRTLVPTAAEHAGCGDYFFQDL